MNGDRLKALEQGFLDGSLGDKEEKELRDWIKGHPDHHLAPYFQWTTEEVSDIPDFQSTVKLSETRSNALWMKVAAALLVLAIAGFLLKDEISAPNGAQFSEAEIDQSYEATMETLSAMASFLDKGLNDTQEACNMAQPFEKLHELKNENSK